MVTPPNDADAGPGLYVCTLHARKHGLAMLIFSNVFIALLCSFPFWFGLEVRGRFAYGYFGMAALVYLAFVFYSVTNLISGGTWWCVLTSDELDVRVPHRLLGESFRLPVAEIRKLEKVVSRVVADTDAEPEYYLVDAAGRRHRLTSNAAFEPQRVFDELLKLRPIEYVERYA